MPQTNLPENGKEDIKFEEVVHTADVALRIYGRGLQELFINAGHGVTSLLCEDPSKISGQIEEKVDIDADDTEGLLVEWLSELCFLVETQSLVFNRFHMEKVTQNQLKAYIYGDEIDSIKTHIKAVTYHNLKIEKTDPGLVATVVFDI